MSRIMIHSCGASILSDPATNTFYLLSFMSAPIKACPKCGKEIVQNALKRIPSIKKVKVHLTNYA